MVEALRRLISGVIDYAGLYPPAKLSVSEAVDKYYKHTSGPNSWLVSRFICPASRLDELADVLRARGDFPNIPLSLTGTGSSNIDAFETGLEADAKAMTEFENEFGLRAPIEAFEVKLPSHKDIHRVLKDLEAFDSINVFLELPWEDHQTDAMATVAEEEWLGVKGRTGGVEASMFPSVRQVAAFIQQAVDLDLKFKLTAGLHHPVRAYHESVKTKMHGFLNVLFATALHDEYGLGIDEIAEILADENASSFVLGKSGIRWNDLEADIDLISETRQLFVGYGSCSVDEPIEDLRSLGLLSGDN